VSYPILSLLLILALLTACGSQPLQADRDPAGDSDLQLWLSQTLIPYVTQQLATHPRFSGQPVVLVKLDGADIQPDIDRLTRSIREKIEDALLTTPGIILPWEPAQLRQRHHRQQAVSDCRTRSQAEIYIGIEIRSTIGEQQRLSLRAFDPRSGQWVSGFGRSWQGRLTVAELNALYQAEIDESLRGLRLLPFASARKDLAAAYLANNLSCLMRQREALPKVFVDTSNAPTGGLPELLRMTGNQLVRYRALRITERRSEAELLLQGELFTLEKGLSQVWLRLTPNSGGEHIGGLDTATYLLDTPLASKNPQQPAVSSLQLDHCGDGCLSLRAETRQAERLYLLSHTPGEGVMRWRDSDCRGQDRTYRQLQIESLPARSHTTFYAIAVAGKQPRQVFDQLFDELPDNCRTGRPRLTASVQAEWLQRLDQVAGRYRR